MRAEAPGLMGTDWAMMRDEAAEALAQAEFFNICDEEQRRMLAFASDLRQFDADSVVYRAGETPLGAHVLISGTMRARPEERGGGRPYAISEPGSMISSMALILDRPRPVTISAVTDCRTLFVPRAAFLKLIQQAPDLARRATARLERDLQGYLGALEPVRQRLKTD